jgi:hypothetical protein
LRINQNVFVQDQINKTWKKAVIKEIGPEPRSYTLLSSDGKILKRNRVHIRPQKVSFGNSKEDEWYYPYKNNNYDEQEKITVYLIILIDSKELQNL